jgi:hypothetical protein
MPSSKVGNRTPVVYGVEGLSSAEIAPIEAELGFRLPEDFVYLFQSLRDPGRVLFPWSDFKKQEYDDQIRWVLEGIEFDIKHAKFWLDRWGRRPATLSAALDLARRDFETWPKLLPISGRRFFLPNLAVAAILYSRSVKLTSSTTVRIWHIIW